MHRTPIANLVVCGVVAAGWAVAGDVAPVRAQASATQENTALALRIFQEAALNARAAYPRLAGPPPRVVPGNAQYQLALTRLQAGQFLEAMPPMQLALRANPTSALYHGDAAAIQIGLQSVDDASLELVRARQAQPQNQWYTVGLAAVMALRFQWAEAAINLDAAVATDSSMIDSVKAEAGVAWSWRGRRAAQAQAWALIASTRYPGIAEPWLRLATFYRQQHDTARGMQAIVRFRALRPADHVGQLLYAFYLYDAGRADSALAMASAAAEDSAQRDRAAEVMYGVGARAFQAAGSDTVPASAAARLDTALLALHRALPLASPEFRPRVHLVLGYAQLTSARDQVLTSDRIRSCEPAMRLDSIIAAATQNLNAGMPVDSARVAGILANVLPQYQTRTTALVQRVCPARQP